MRQNMELSAMPPAFTVEQEDEKAIISFFTDVQEVEREDGTAYLAEVWSMNCPWQPTLPHRVSENPELWLAKIKSITTAEESAAELERLKQTATDDAICELAEIVADLVGAVTELAGMIA